MSTLAINTTTVYPLAVVQAVLGAFVVCLDVPPLIWHCKHGNFPACTMVFLILLMNLFNTLNALIWPNDDIASWYNGVGFCDIQVKMFYATTTALPGAIVCILRKLARVMDTKNIVISPSKTQKRRDLVFDLALCVGIPVLTILFSMLVQAPRYIVIGITGCAPQVAYSWPAIVLINFPPLLISLWGAYYAILIGCRLRKYRCHFDALLHASDTSKTRFLRLFLLALTLIVFIVPLQAYFVYANWPRPTLPFSWSAIHSHAAWTEIPLVPSYGSVGMDHWVQLANGILVFVFFGLGKDATAMYAAWASSLGLKAVASRISSVSSSLIHKTNFATFADSSKQTRFDVEKGTTVAVVKTVSTTSTADTGDDDFGVTVRCA